MAGEHSSLRQAAWDEKGYFVALRFGTRRDRRYRREDIMKSLEKDKKTF